MVTLLVGDIDWVDYDFCQASVCQVLSRQMGVWQNWLGKWARWWNIQNQGQPNPCPRPPLYTRPLASIPAGNPLFPLSAVAFYNLKVHRGKKVEEVGDTF